MKIKELKESYDYSIKLYKLSDIKDSVNYTVLEKLLYKGNMKSIPVEHDNNELITAYPVFDANHKIECVKMFI